MDNSQMPAHPCVITSEKQVIATLGYKNGYPVTIAEPSYETTSYSGLTKLESFTMAAMQGIVNGLIVAGGTAGHGWSFEEIATESVKVARATLSELSKQQ